MFKRLFQAVMMILAAGPAIAAEPLLRVERVVMLMRHGVRPPTKLQPIPPQYAAASWPEWSTGPGLLTPHGAKGVAILAEADRAFFAGLGLLAGSGCPAPGQVTVTASKVPRAIETAKAWAAAFAPGCGLLVEHPADGAPDTLFHPLDGGPAWFDGRRAWEDALAEAPPGGLERQARELSPLIRELEMVLGCVAPACDLEEPDSALVEQPHDRPKLHGPLGIASTASETLLLEYLENKPLSEVGWGRIDRPAIERLLTFNAVEFQYVDRPRAIAQGAAGPLARAILGALEAPDAARVTLLAGHDTNIADLGGLLGIHWRAASYPADTVPPGGALVFELLSDGAGKRFVRALFRAQTMDQLRNLEPLAGDGAPRAFVTIPGCGNAADVGCELATFGRLVRASLTQARSVL